MTMLKKVANLTLALACMTYISSTVSAQEYSGDMRYNGSMCVLKGNQGNSSKNCLSLTVNGAQNVCSYPITVVCPLVFDKPQYYEEVKVDVWNPSNTGGVSARVIWQDDQTWYWGYCQDYVTSRPGATYSLSDVCGPDIRNNDYYALQVTLPGYNSRVYGYTALTPYPW